MEKDYTSITLNSNPRNVTIIESYLQGLAESYDLSHDVYGNMLISVTEAVTNAIMHGNGKDENKKVEVRCNCGKHCLDIIVSDEGPGFDPNGIPDPTNSENLCKPNGRGVFLMKELADEIRFMDNGSTVIIKFHLC